MLLLHFYSFIKLLFFQNEIYNLIILLLPLQTKNNISQIILSQIGVWLELNDVLTLNSWNDNSVLIKLIEEIVLIFRNIAKTVRIGHNRFTSSIRIVIWK